MFRLLLYRFLSKTVIWRQTSLRWVMSLYAIYWWTDMKIIADLIVKLWNDKFEGKLCISTGPSPVVICRLGYLDLQKKCEADYTWWWREETHQALAWNFPFGHYSILIRSWKSIESYHIILFLSKETLHTCWLWDRWYQVFILSRGWGGIGVEKRKKSGGNKSKYIF